jgi:hypothetical protein
MVAAAAAVMIIARGLLLPSAGWPLLGRLALWSLVCGLLGYVFYGMGLPGSGALEGVIPGLRGLVIGFLSGLLPLFYAVVSGLLARRARARG